MSRLELARKRSCAEKLATDGPRRMYAGTMLDYHIDDEPDIVGAGMCVWGSCILHTCMRVVLCVGKYVVMYGLAFAFVRSTFVVAALMRAREYAFRRLVFANTHGLRT